MSVVSEKFTGCIGLDLQFKHEQFKHESCSATYAGGMSGMKTLGWELGAAVLVASLMLVDHREQKDRQTLLKILLIRNFLGQWS